MTGIGANQPFLRAGRPWLLTVLAGVLLLQASPVLGCSTCFGQSDSPLAEGMNMGILCLLGVLAAVLSGVAGFFIYLARRSSRVLAGVPGRALQETSIDVQQ